MKKLATASACLPRPKVSVVKESWSEYDDDSAAAALSLTLSSASMIPRFDTYEYKSSHLGSLLPLCNQIL